MNNHYRHLLNFQSRPNTAPSLGPVLGGVLAQEAGWRWIFGFLSILSGLTFILMFTFFPETSRTVVGNGSIPPHDLNRSLLAYLQKRQRSSDEEGNQQDATGKTLIRPKLRIPNPLSSLRIIFHKDISLILYANGVFYMNYQCIQASLSTLFMQIYGLDALQAGLCYLPYGIGCTIASYVTGRTKTKRLLDPQPTNTIKD